MVKNLLVLLCGLASVAGSAFAADLPSREIGPAPALAPVFTWAGFYIGTQTAAINLDGNVRTSGNAGSTIAEVASLRRPASLSLDDTNLASGAQVGFNVQYGAIVLGLEGDLAFADVSPRSLFFSPASDPSAFRQDLEWFGTARGRVGFAFDQALIYATGGLAFGDVTNKVAFLRNTDFAFQHMGRSSDWGVGYAIGGGVEFLLPAFLGNFSIVGRLLGASSVTVKAEYLYFDLGDKNVLVNAVPGAGINSFTSNFETKGHTGRIGFNYRFGT